MLLNVCFSIAKVSIYSDIAKLSYQLIYNICQKPPYMNGWTSSVAICNAICMQTMKRTSFTAHGKVTNRA